MTRPSRVLVFCGWSAVGKQTCIRRLLAGDPALRARFGVSGRIYAVGKNFEPLNRERCREADTVLVQWQIREHDRIRTLREWFPPGEHEHRVYLLLRDWEQHKQALEARGVPTTVGELISNTAWIINTFFVDTMVEYVQLPEVEL